MKKNKKQQKKQKSEEKIIYITDGYQYWNKECPMCHENSMEIVRPGKVQCWNCG